MEKQQRRELPAYFFQTDTNSTQAQRHHFFNQERLCQYVPASTEDTIKPTSSLDNIRRIITKCLWPRLVVVRVRHVLSALLPLLNLDETGTLYVAMGWGLSMVSPLGWVLHGLRLLINAIELLQQAQLLVARHDADNVQTWYERVDAYIQDRGTAIGNDLIWILTAIAPTSLGFTCVFLIIDVLWLGGRAGLKMQRLNASIDAVDSIRDSHLFLEITKKIGEEQKTFFLNLANLLSISTIGMIKNFILPTFFPILALNPLLLLAFSVLSLAITIISHLLEQAWVGENSGDEMNKINRTTTLPFFSDLHPSNEEEMIQPVNIECAL